MIFSVQLLQPANTTTSIDFAELEFALQQWTYIVMLALQEYQDQDVCNVMLWCIYTFIHAPCVLVQTIQV